MLFVTTESELRVGAGISVFYFYADWLLYHKKIKIMIEKVELLNNNINFCAIDIDYFDGICKRFNVNTLPTIIIMKDGGKEIKRITGLVSTDSFIKTILDIYDLYGESNAQERK